MDEYAKELNGVAASPNGKFFLKRLIKGIGVFTPQKGKDGVALIENNAQRNIYLELIRPHLEPQIRMELEN